LVGYEAALGALAAALRAQLAAVESLAAECGEVGAMLSSIDTPRTRAFLASETRGAARAAEVARSAANDAARTANEVRKGLVPAAK
jgi:hypothetical protein